MLTVREFDKSTQRDRKLQMSKEKMPLTFKMLQEFLEQRIVMLESLQVLPNSTVNKKSVTNTRVHVAYSNACALCDEDHFLQRCDLFLGKKPAYREAFVLGYHKKSDVPQ